MILYFSGTGNSGYAARRIAGGLGEPLLYLNDRIRAGDTAPVETGERLVIVTPTYAWRIPRIVEDWLLHTELTGAKRAWFVMTCGSEIGDADRYNRRLCQAKGLVCMGTAQIVMPENYIAMFNAPQAEEARQIVARAEPDIDGAIAAVRENRAFPPPRRKFYDRFMSGPVNPIFYSCFVKANAFTVGNACTGCGQCVRRCPLNNITLQTGKPVWGQDCTHCMACICYCPRRPSSTAKRALASHGIILKRCEGLLDTQLQTMCRAAALRIVFVGTKRLYLRGFDLAFSRTAASGASGENRGSFPRQPNFFLAFFLIFCIIKPYTIHRYTAGELFLTPRIFYETR